MARLLRAAAIAGGLVWSGQVGAQAVPAACPDAAGCPSQDLRVPDGAMQAAVHDAQHEESAQLLQRVAAPRRAATIPVTPELEKIFPIGWMHCPKCGTSFLNTLIHLPGVCPGVEDDLIVDYDHFPGASWRFTNLFNEQYNVPRSCPGLASHYYGHMYIKFQPGYERVKGHFMGMFRQPEQRTMATFYDLSFCAKIEPMINLLNPARSWGGLPERRVPGAREFAEWYRGCTVKMLTRPALLRGGYPCGDGTYPTEAEVTEAKEMLHNEFKFIGMTNDWALSICLLSAQFKSPCLPAMFADSRTSRKDDTRLYKLDPLENVTDPYDGALFEEATKIFKKRLKKYNVSEASCRDGCWHEAGLDLD
mmetsp:Transcript_402/g.1124  ORF Transcript_402/g.1124 Transcript_402/m.1124 type:complete len:363 (-) Transcript_402:132-1220(-)